jgi:hypothetical protein
VKISVIGTNALLGIVFLLAACSSAPQSSTEPGSSALGEVTGATVVSCDPTPCLGVGTGIEATPNTATGACPCGETNALTDSAGNFCCVAMGCSLVGTGIEATPNTAAGTCPAGQANTLTDSAGDFCCSPAPCFGVGSGVEATPDTAAGICPAGQSNTLTDPAGNFCCAPIACFGIGSGVEATPDTAAGTCPDGQSNTLTDAHGNFCCAPIACFGVGTGVEATPNTAAGTCPAGQSNTLTDAEGNFCCAPTACFGVGTGVEATPNTAAGTCPAGQSNTLTDAQGNFCCATAAPLAPCTEVGQPNCVACNNGSANSLCTPTEAAILASDIAKGYVTAATATGPTDGCYSCLESVSALDDSTDTEQECGDTTDPNACLATLTCILQAECATVAVNVCYCGTAPVSTSCNEDGSGAANGACAATIAAGFGQPVTNGHTILSEFTRRTAPSGEADAIFARAITNGCTECQQ